MKKIVLISIVFLIFHTACVQAPIPTDDSERDKISAITTIFPPYNFTSEISGDRADIYMLIPPGGESHSYEPSPKDIIKIQEADLFIYIGGESERWVDGILSSIDTHNIKTLSLIDSVEVLEEEIVEGMEDAEEEEDIAYDEHIWTSPKNAKLMVEKISDALCEIDSENSDFYKSNTSLYLNKLDLLDKRFTDIVKEGSLNTIIFADRFPFRYFADTYGLNYFAAFPGCSSATEPSAKTMTFLIEKIKSEKVPVVFHGEMYTGKIIDVISESTGAVPHLFHACHNISKTDFENGVGYISLMNENADRLKEALG